MTWNYCVHSTVLAWFGYMTESTLWISCIYLSSSRKALKFLENIMFFSQVKNGKQNIWPGLSNVNRKENNTIR